MANIQNFFDSIKLELVDVATIQLHTIQNSVLVELTSDDLAKQYHNRNNLKHVVVHEGKSVKIPVYTLMLPPLSSGFMTFLRSFLIPL